MSGLDWSKRDEHTKRKHDILSEYLKAWIKITASHFPKIFVVDGFAGRGEYKNGDPGSPKIIISAACAEIATKNCTAECFFIEIEDDPFNVMEKVVTQNNTQSKKVIPYFLKGNFEDKIYEVFDSITLKEAPCFFFIDPTGFKDIDLEIIREIGGFRRPEILLNLQTAGILRNLQQPKLKDKIIKVFGETLPAGSKEKDVIKKYKDVMKNKCSFKHVQHYPVSFDEVNRPVYQLIHAANNDTGFKIMKEIWEKYGGSYKGLKESQTSLLDGLERIEKVNTVKKYLMQNYKKGDILDKGKGLKEILELPGCVTVHYTQALKELEQEGKINRESKRIEFL